MGRNHVVAVLVGLVLALGCGGKKGSDSGKPKVAVSIVPLYDLTRRIAGDRAEVILVMPPGRLRRTGSRCGHRGEMAVLRADENDPPWQPRENPGGSMCAFG